MDTNSNQKVSCRAKYAYEASEPDELSLRAGDLVHSVERLDGGWWRGELRGRRGLFPDNFVTVVDQDTQRSGGAGKGKCRAVFSYQPANPDELPLCVGDVLEVLGEVEEGWWQGRRQGREGVFPSNFVVMLETSSPPPPYEPAPALPPKPVKEVCRVLFPYTAVNEDELTLAAGELVTVLSKDGPDQGWWRGELRGKQGMFPDNFVQLLPPGSPEVEEKKPDRPPVKTAATTLYPILNKYSEKTASVKELTTSKISLHKDNTVSKESSTQSTVTSTNKTESEKIIHNESAADTHTETQVKKPAVPTKKSPTPSIGVGGLFSGLKSKMLSSSDKDKSSTISSSGSNSSGEWDKTDGAASSRAATNLTTLTNTNTFDHVERNSILNDPRAARVKAPRRRPPSQVLRDDTPQQIGLSNGHEVPTEKPSSEKSNTEKASEEIKPKAREWEKHRAPWMAELKMNQAKKTNVTSDTNGTARAGSTERILDCGVEEKRSSHAMEMSKSTSSISGRISAIESFEETKTRYSLDSKEATNAAKETEITTRTNHSLSPTAAGRTFTTMLEEIKKPLAPSPPAVSIRTSMEAEKISTKMEKTSSISTEKVSEVKLSTIERNNNEKRRADDKNKDSNSTADRLQNSFKSHDKNTDALVAHLNNRISTLEKLLEVQNAKFTVAIEELHTKLELETEKRLALQTELEKLAHCVTQV